MNMTGPELDPVTEALMENPAFLWRAPSDGLVLTLTPDPTLAPPRRRKPRGLCAALRTLGYSKYRIGRIGEDAARVLVTNAVYATDLGLGRIT